MKLKEVGTGLKAYSTAFDVIGKHDLWPFMLIPGALSAVFFLVMAIVGWLTIGGITESIIESLPDWMQGWLTSLVLGSILVLLLILLAIFTVKYIVLIVLSPVLSYLSEKTEEKMYGTKAPELNMKEMMSDISRALAINLRNLALELGMTFVLFIGSFIPILGLGSPVVKWFVESHYVGFGLVDYTLERKRYSVGQTVDWVAKNRELTIGLGMGFMLITMVPLIGWFLAPVIGTVASTVAVLENLEAEASQS